MNICNNVTIIIVTYNHLNYIKDCIESLDDLSEIIVIDNGSCDGTPEFIEANFPQIKVIITSNNMGYGAANNIGALNSTKDFLVILNPDTKMMPNCLENLLKPLIDKDAIITMPKVLYYDGKKINTCGNKLHITGMAFTRGEGEKPDKRNDSMFLNGLSGVCFAISKDNYFKLGGFDENIFLYMEDTELSWRICSQGIKIFYVPKSIVCHDYELSLNSEKLFHVEMGRYIILRKYFTKRDYFRLLPSLVMTEVLTWGYAILNGASGIHSKVNAIYHGFSMPIDKFEADRNMLLSQMNYQIPDLEFKFKRIFNIFRKIANSVYLLNLKLIK